MMNHDGSDETLTPHDAPATPDAALARPTSVVVDANGVKRLRLGIKAGDVYMQYPRGSNNRLTMG